ncbi:MAG: AMP-binding protein, partial [Myxococcota bacterium]
MDGGPEFQDVFELLDPAQHGYHSAQLIEHWARVQPDVIAVARAAGRDERGRSRFATKTFRELNELADTYAHALEAAGVCPADRVVLFLTDPIELFAVVYACAKLQAVFVLIDPGMGVKNLLACVEEQRPAALVGVPKAHVL